MPGPDGAELGSEINRTPFKMPEFLLRAAPGQVQLVKQITKCTNMPMHGIKRRINRKEIQLFQESDFHEGQSVRRQSRPSNKHVPQQSFQ